MLTVDQALELGRGPADEVRAWIAAAPTMPELEALRLAVCAHPQVGALAAVFAARRSQLLAAPAPRGVPE